MTASRREIRSLPSRLTISSQNLGSHEGQVGSLWQRGSSATAPLVLPAAIARVHSSPQLNPAQPCCSILFSTIGASYRSALPTGDTFIVVQQRKLQFRIYKMQQEAGKSTRQFGFSSWLPFHAGSPVPPNCETEREASPGSNQSASSASKGITKWSALISFRTRSISISFWLRT